MPGDVATGVGEPGSESTWIVATSNLGKRREFAEILAGRSVTLLSLADFDEVLFPEEGLEYERNAIVKAETAARQLGRVAVADDSGLEVDALDGAPGPLSARYGGDGLDDAARVQKLLVALRSVPDAERSARFVCVAALATPDGRVMTTRGECPGRILQASRGGAGFGYDPIFEPEGHGQSMAELAPALKNTISHRALALAQLWEKWRQG